MIDNEVRQSQARILTLDETMSIRGAFWGSLLNIVAFAVNIAAIALAPFTGGASLALLPFVTLIRVGALFASIIEGDWASAISAGIGIVLGPINPATEAVGVADAANTAVNVADQANTASGIVSAFHSIQNVFSGVVGVLQDVHSFAEGVFTAIGLGGAAADLASFAVSTGLSVGVSYGLSALGVDPELSGFLGGLAAGAFVGATSQLTESVTVNGVTKIVNIAENPAARAIFFESTVMSSLIVSDVGNLG
ncbi:MAG: hypothetical protein ACI9Y8_000866, partial [Candidatus Omnitrophota bacterium]